MLTQTQRRLVYLDKISPIAILSRQSKNGPNVYWQSWTISYSLAVFNSWSDSSVGTNIQSSAWNSIIQCTNLFVESCLVVAPSPRFALEIIVTSSPTSLSWTPWKSFSNRNSVFFIQNDGFCSEALSKCNYIVARSPSPYATTSRLFIPSEELRNI